MAPRAVAAGGSRRPDIRSGPALRAHVGPADAGDDDRLLHGVAPERLAELLHDNGIIALGFRRYGFAAEAARVARDISEAASYFVSYRLPELYAGIERRPGTFPVQYLTANVPQAWAAGKIWTRV